MTSTSPYGAPAAWDRDPQKLAMSRRFARLLRARIALCSHWSALEYGCGTANLSVGLAHDLARIIAVDADAGMITHATGKLTGLGLTHLSALKADLTAEPHPTLPETPYDLIYSAMALHHIEAVPLLLQRFAALLVPGGHLALFDLLAEDGSFHGTQSVPHNGFDPAELAGQLCGAGFTRVRIDAVHQLERPQPDGSPRAYPIFLAHAVLDG